MERIVKAIAYELCDIIPEYATIIEQYVNSDIFKKHTAQELFLELIINPFEKINIEDTSKYFYFIIDAIDELNTNKINVLDDFLSLLHSHVKHLPSCIRLILTSPSSAEISDTLKLLDCKIIQLNSPKNASNIRNDAKNYLEYELQALDVKYSNSEVDIVLEKSECNFDYLHYFIRQCEDLERFPNPSDLPTGLMEQYTYDFKNRFEKSFYNEKIRPILQVLSDAYIPLTVEDISQILEMEMSSLYDIVRGQLSQFLRFERDERNKETICLYSRSLEIWLNDAAHSFCLIQNNKSLEIIRWIKRKGQLFYNNEYLRKYGLLHLWENGEKDYIINELIINSDDNRFEQIKEELAGLYIELAKRDENSDSYTVALISFFSQHYLKTFRIRDILVYSYRFIAGYREKQYQGLKDIIDLLNTNHDEVRARLLLGESIDDYAEAKKSFQDTISFAKSIVEEVNSNVDKTHNKWWCLRMLGIAYNRLAHLEAREGNVDEAIIQYSNGKKCFDDALLCLKQNGTRVEFAEKTKYDKKTLERDEAIINERMGDLYSLKREYSKAQDYYTEYFNYCQMASKTNEIKAMWDLSTSKLRRGDCFRYLGFPQKAYLEYKEALFHRKDILQNLRNDCYEKVFTNRHRVFIPFDCPEQIDIGDDFIEDKVPRESRDIDPVRDIGLCYVRLGDLAYSLSKKNIASEYYNIYYLFCDIAINEAKTKITDNDMQVCTERQQRIAS